MVKTGVGGNCVATPNRTLSAPIVETYLAAVAARNALFQPAEINQAAAKFTVFSNPGKNGSVSVHFVNETSPQDVIVIDANGRTVKQWKNYSNSTLTVNTLRPGFYNLQGVNNFTGEKKSKKILIAD